MKLAFVRGWATCGLPVIRTELMPSAGNTSYKPTTLPSDLVITGQDYFRIADDPPSESDTINIFLIESGNPLTGDHQTCGTNR